MTLPPEPSRTAQSHTNKNTHAFVDDARRRTVSSVGRAHHGSVNKGPGNRERGRKKPFNIPKEGRIKGKGQHKNINSSSHYQTDDKCCCVSLNSWTVGRMDGSGGENRSIILFTSLVNLPRKQMRALAVFALYRPHLWRERMNA